MVVPVCSYLYLQAVLLPEEVVELCGPPVLHDGRARLLPELGVVGVVVPDLYRSGMTRELLLEVGRFMIRDSPVGGLEDGVLPEVVAEHLLEEADHRAQRGCHPVVLRAKKVECVE